MAYWFDGQGGWIKEGNGAATFLNEVTGERFVLAGMMSEKKRQSIFEGRPNSTYSVREGLAVAGAA